MSVSKSQLEEYAKYILNHEALEEVKMLVDKRLIARFRSASREQRDELNHMMDATSLFLQELKNIVGESVDLTEDNEEVKAK